MRCKVYKRKPEGRYVNCKGQTGREERDVGDNIEVNKQPRFLVEGSKSPLYGGVGQNGVVFTQDTRGRNGPPKSFHQPFVLRHCAETGFVKAQYTRGQNDIPSES